MDPNVVVLPTARYLTHSLLLIFALSGCQPPIANPHAKAADRKEFWDAIYFDDNKVGYSHTVYEFTDRAGTRLVDITADSEIAVQRFGQTTKQRLHYHSHEKSDGELLSFGSSMSSADAEAAAFSLEAAGSVQGDQLTLELKSAGKTQTAQLQWNRKWGGYFAIDQSLSERPLRAGERRTLRALMPGFNQASDIELIAKHTEPVDTLEGPRDLLRIECQIKLGKNVLEQILWIDSSGQIIKSYMPTLKQISYRTSKAKAMAPGSGTFDLGEKTIVKLNRVIDRPHQTRKIVYRATLANGDIRTAFAEGSTQQIRPIDEHTAELTVRALRPADELGNEFPNEPPAIEQDLAANSLIQSDDAEVARMANQVAAKETDAWVIAVALERYVRETIKDKNFSQALSSAAEVARSREGDCTEHAVLLAALCRARKIPARISIGLVYHRPSNGFAYHMWTDVWIKDRWIPLDGTLGQGGIGAAHLAVSHSSLQGVDPLSQFLPVLNLLGNLKLEVVRVE